MRRRADGDDVGDENRYTGRGEGLRHDTGKGDGETEDESDDYGDGEVDAGEQTEEDTERASDEDSEDVREAGAVGATVVDDDDLEGAERGPSHGLAEEIAAEHDDAYGEGGAEASPPLHFGESGTEAGDANDRHFFSRHFLSVDASNVRLQ